MNNYYLLIYLKRALEKNLYQGKFLFAISPHKDVIEFYINNNDRTLRLILSTNPDETALFIDKYRPPKKQNVFYFFKQIEGQHISKIHLAKNDRLITISFESGYKLLFKLYGHDVNVFLVNNDTIKDAFKHPEASSGQAPPVPNQPNFKKVITEKAKAKNQLTQLNPLLPRPLLKSLIKQHGVDKMNIKEVKA